jgi:hypothetical protein
MGEMLRLSGVIFGLNETIRPTITIYAQSSVSHATDLRPAPSWATYPEKNGMFSIIVTRPFTGRLLLSIGDESVISEPIEYSFDGLDHDEGDFNFQLSW